jgi:hypothetical protein
MIHFVKGFFTICHSRRGCPLGYEGGNPEKEYRRLISIAKIIILKRAACEKINKQNCLQCFNVKKKIPLPKF